LKGLFVHEGSLSNEQWFRPVVEVSEEMSQKPRERSLGRFSGTRYSVSFSHYDIWYRCEKSSLNEMGCRLLLWTVS